ncbi:integrase-like catalytic domain superfamily [Holotrichia oblita]|uniref:Integrase-like catalytic domain superfamily n=1 Tax=Holotrichia oblita TaxID=644536 RepID=A0ACB9TJV1_HOLOL|nr:integrase-like catalytic domain superfamily [Holotrichia oblita]
MWIDVVTRYLLIRPSPDIPRLFIGFRSGKPTRQNMGHNTISTSAIKIATYLKLPDANNYTGHSFKRTSATILADNGGDILSFKRHGGWKSFTVAEGYVEDSITDKKRIASIVRGTTVNYEPDLPPSTSIFEVTPSISTSVSKSNTELNIPVENFTSTVQPLETGQSVFTKVVPNSNIWNKRIVNEKVKDRSYLVEVEQKSYRRNREHIKPVNLESEKERYNDKEKIQHREEIIGNSGELKPAKESTSKQENKEESNANALQLQGKNEDS